MKSHCFYQGNKLSAIGSISEMSVMLQSSFAPLAEQRVGAIDNTVLIATNSASSIVHAAGATPYAPYGHFDLIRHGSVLGFNGQARDPVTHSDLLGMGSGYSAHRSCVSIRLMISVHSAWVVSMHTHIVGVTLSTIRIQREI